MSIEQASQPATTHTASRAQAGRGAHAQVARQGAAPSGPVSSFEQLLTAMSAVTDDTDGAASPAASSAQPSAKGAQQPELAGELVTDGTLTTAPDLALPAWPKVVDDPQLVQAGPPETPADVLVPPLVGGGGAGPMAQGPAVGGSVAAGPPASTPSAMKAASDGERRNPLVLSPMAAATGQSTGSAAPVAIDDRTGAVETSTTLQPSPRSDLTPVSALRRSAGQLGESGQPHAARGSSQEMQTTSLAAGVAAPILSPAESATLASPFRAWREPERREAGPGPVSMHAIETGTPSTGAALTSYALSAPDAPVAATAVAEKLFYWVTGGVQNAELQVDAFGGGTVEVSVSLRGSDATVEFRSDQPEARRLLQDAMGQLRSMLQDEGLTLSGGFVGTSGRDGTEQPQQRRRADWMQGRAIASIAPTEAARGAAGSGPAGSRIDVFV